MLRAVPAMIRQACSMSRALRSVNLVSAIFLTWSAVTVPTLVLLRYGRAGGDARGLLEQHGGGRALGDELERPVGVDGDLDRDGRPLHLLGPFVELHHELTDVDAVLAQGRPDRGGRRGLAAGALELHLRRHHLGHRCISLSLRIEDRDLVSIARGMSQDPSGHPALCRSDSFHLPVFEVDRGRPVEDDQHHLDQAAALDDFLDGPLEVLERTVLDLDPVAALDVDADLGVSAVGLLRLPGRASG